MKMIPTNYKFKISKDLSWPVNAKILSEALEGVPQYSRLSICFSEYSTFLKSEFLRRIQKEETILVLSADYSNIKPHWSSSKYSIEMGMHDETWEITVYPVPRDISAKVREAICEYGFPAIRRWLTKKRPPIWYDGRKFLNLGYNLEEGKLFIRES